MADMAIQQVAENNVSLIKKDIMIILQPIDNLEVSNTMIETILNI